MKRNTLSAMRGLVVAVVLAASGCGGGSHQDILMTPPRISNLQYAPASATVNTSTSFDWQFDFSDTGGDISTGTYTVYNPSGVQVFAKTIDLSIPAGIKQGTQHGTTTNVTFLTVGVYTVKMFITDRFGASSNVLDATFTIVP